MAYLFILLATIGSMLSGFLLNNAVTLPAPQDGTVSAKPMLLLLSGFLFTTAAFLLIAAFQYRP